MAEEVGAGNTVQAEEAVELRDGAVLPWGGGGRCGGGAVIALRGENTAFPALDTPESEDGG